MKPNGLKEDVLQSLGWLVVFMVAFSLVLKFFEMRKKQKFKRDRTDGKEKKNGNKRVC